MRTIKTFFPFNRWISAMIILFTVYFMYGIFGNIIDETLPNAATDLDVSPYASDVIDYVGQNFFIAILILFGGALFYMFIAGVPGQQEERLI